ncbi:MAG: hypothetical protein R3321_11620 [Nitrososphaeraceae archaeon]|nr:hypothetical protein [Nitrososphaeraceae archaeon]
MVKQENKLTKRLCKNKDGSFEWIDCQEYLKRMDELILEDIDSSYFKLHNKHPLFVLVKD